MVHKWKIKYMTTVVQSTGGTNWGLPFHRLSLHGKYRNGRELRSVDSESRTLQSLKNQKYSRKGSNLKSKEGNKMEFEEIAQKQERGKNKPPSRRDTRENHLPAIAAFGGRAPQWRPPCPEHSSGSNNHKPWAGDMAPWARALAALTEYQGLSPSTHAGQVPSRAPALIPVLCGRLCSPACTHTQRKRQTGGPVKCSSWLIFIDLLKILNFSSIWKKFLMLLLCPLQCWGNYCSCMCFLPVLKRKPRGYSYWPTTSALCYIYVSINKN